MLNKLKRKGKFSLFKHDQLTSLAHRYKAVKIIL